MKKAALYARVSSKDQEKEGFSIPAQLKLLREYAVKNNIKIVRDFVDVETAKTTGRKQFGEMVRFFQQRAECRVVIVEKTARLWVTPITSSITRLKLRKRMPPLLSVFLKSTGLAHTLWPSCERLFVPKL